MYFHLSLYVNKLQGQEPLQPLNYVVLNKNIRQEMEDLPPKILGKVMKNSKGDQLMEGTIFLIYKKVLH